MDQGKSQEPSQQTSPAFLPAVPQVPGALGVPWALVLDIAMRRVYLDGSTSLTSLSRALKLSFMVTQAVFDHFRKNSLVDITGSQLQDFTFSLTSKGEQLARSRLQLTEYTGPVPVSIQEYSQAVRSQAAEIDLNQQILESALSDLVVTEDLVEQLGPALVSQKSLFLYGPTGSGKTSLAERLVRVYQDVILVPHAVEIDNQVVTVYDPIVHEPAEIGEEEVDPRWVPCRRPSVVVGGELTSEMLELRLDTATNIYAAPMQMKANNGLLVIDDFGRQAISPRQLLNRWIIPLDRKVDYLTLRHGKKFPIPFELMVVFATNLDPRELTDEAFFRRIHNKIYVPPCEPEVFDAIFHRLAQQQGLRYAPDAPAYLRKLCQEAGSSELRACHPADILSILGWISRYKHQPIDVSKTAMERAAGLYFAQDRESRKLGEQD